MSRLEHAREVADLAKQLGLSTGPDPVAAILAHCRSRIDGWVAEDGPVPTAADLQRVVAARLQLVLEDVHTDDDFARIKAKYATGQRDFVFAAMRTKFDGGDNPTYGALVKRKNVPADAPDRYVAVIDCRGGKRQRRFFTRWHEIAHRLTTDSDEPEYRSEHDPIERLMDEIAGHVGFYGPLFEPVFLQAGGGRSLLTFGVVRAVIQEGFPDASFQATLNACTRRTPTPVMYVEAALAHKKEERRRNQTPSLFGDAPPPGQLRAVTVQANDAARNEGFMIPKNMRVPERSVIHRLFAGDDLADGVAREDLGWWESQGTPQPARAVAVEARKVADRVIATFQPVEPKRETPGRGRRGGSPLFDG